MKRPSERPVSTELATGLQRIAGFGGSMVILAATSLAVIPAMIHASGAEAWGRIATGQAIGGVAAVVLALGWGISGPARIARAGPADRHREYRESLATRMALVPPVLIVAGSITWMVGGDHRFFALAGLVSAASIGLTANWYFIGIARPWLLLITETLPRAAGSLLSILVMLGGANAMVGVLIQSGGMIAGFLVSTRWILRQRGSTPRLPRRPVRSVLLDQRHGLSSTTLSMTAVALPVVIVGLVAPAGLAVYALLDKLLRQINAGLTLYTSVLQGWIPHGLRSEVLARVRTALRLTLIVTAVVVAAVLLIAPDLVRWLGRGSIHPPAGAIALTAAIVGVTLVESVVSRAGFPALDRLATLTHLTAIGSVLTVGSVTLGAWAGGARGALIGLLTGLTTQLIMELISLFRERGSAPAGSTRLSETVDRAR